MPSPAGSLRLLPLLALCLAAPASGGPQERVPAPPGERVRFPRTGAEFLVLRDPSTGRKVLERADGARFASPEEAARAEDAALPPLRRRLHPALWAAAEDPARAGERVRVVLVLGSQPVREAALAARPAVARAVAAPLAALRASLSRIAPLRDPDPGRLLQLGHRLEEEARLLSAAERADLRRLRAGVQEAVRGMRRAVLDAAGPRAAEDRAPVLAALAAVPGARVLGRSLALSTVSAEVPAGSLEGLAEALPGVARVLPHGVRRASLNTSVATFGATTWTGAGYDGSSSTRVAVLDTGIDSGHPALSPVVTAEAVFLSAGSADPYFADDASSTDDIHGHGTHVGGICMSTNSTYRGVAPGGLLMNAKCGYADWWGGGALQDADIQAAGDWAASNGADSMNGSFGGPGTTDGSSALTLFFEAIADDLGIVVAVAAGNDGPSSGTVGVPGDGFNGITVGSVDDNGTTSPSDDSLSSFSSRGPLDDGRRKPDVCAPGSSITSCNAGWEGSASDFVAFDGTSMATPHVAGAAALLLDYAATWRPEGVKALLVTTTRNASPYPSSPGSSWGWGAADLAAAFAARASVLEGTLASSGPARAFLRLPSLAAGKRVSLCWNRRALAAGSGTPSTYDAPVDLDLLVYDGSSGASLGASESALETVEQAALSAASTAPVVKVLRAGDFPSGQSSVDWAIAAEATASSTAVDPPDLSCALSLGAGLARPGDEFEVRADVVNGGGLPAFAPAVSLSLPPGYSVLQGSNPAVLGTLAAAGGTAAATWTVRAGGTVSGDNVLSAAASSASFGETFASAPAQAVQVLDVLPPWGTVRIEGGAEAVTGPDVSVGIQAFDDVTGAAEYRARNPLMPWTPWKPLAAAFPWTLASGEGVRIVEVQVRDGVANESAVLFDGVFVDQTAPTGSFVLAGGAEYLMPWQALEADTTSADGAEGSGVADFHVRWDPGEAFSAWIPIDGEGRAPLPRPGATQAVTAEGRFRDVAGNVSSSSYDGIHLVAPLSRSLTAAKSFEGALAPGGDVDAFRVGLPAGAVLTVKVKVRPGAAGGDFAGAVDLWDPAGTLVAAGRYPAGGRKPGIAKFVAASSGDHWVVLRPEGADRAAGGSYVLSVRVGTPSAARHARGTADPAGNPLVAGIPFDAAEGALLKGTLRGPVTGPLEVLRPDGTTTPVPSIPSRDGRSRRIPGTLLGGGTGSFLLRAPATGDVEFSLSLKPPKRVKLVEGAD